MRPGSGSSRIAKQFGFLALGRRSLSANGPGCVRTVLSAAKARCPVLVSQFVWEARSFRGADRTPKVSAAQTRYYTLHVAGEHIECHLGCDLLSSSHQEASILGFTAQELLPS